MTQQALLSLENKLDRLIDTVRVGHGELASQLKSLAETVQHNHENVNEKIRIGNGGLSDKIDNCAKAIEVEMVRTSIAGLGSELWSRMIAVMIALALLAGGGTALVMNARISDTNHRVEKLEDGRRAPPVEMPTADQPSGAVVTPKEKKKL